MRKKKSIDPCDECNTNEPDTQHTEQAAAVRAISGISAHAHKQGSSVLLNERGSTTPECDRCFRERLRQLVPAFLDMREHMSVQNIGFGFLKGVHASGHTLGAVPQVKRMESGKLSVTVPAFFNTSSVEIDLPRDQEENILIMPTNLRETQRVVSVHDPFDDYNPVFMRLVDTPNDDVFIGVIAHELAHCYTSKSKFPPKVSSVLERRWKEMHQKGRWRYDTNQEEEVDLIASLYGYKKQVIAKLDFMIDRFQQYGPYFKQKEQVIESLQNRKQQVLLYCP